MARRPSHVDWPIGFTRKERDQWRDAFRRFDRRRKSKLARNMKALDNDKSQD